MLTTKKFLRSIPLSSNWFFRKEGVTKVSGISEAIDILGKKPGIFSARWAGKNQDFKKAIKRVYKELDQKDKDWKNKKIKARFICALSISYLNKKIACVIGKVEGSISHKPKGINGFGYDPIFIPKNRKKTFGEMRSSQKYKIDHRFKAFQKVKKFLEVNRLQFYKNLNDD